MPEIRIFSGGTSKKEGGGGQIHSQIWAVKGEGRRRTVANPSAGMEFDDFLSSVTFETSFE